jgi:hypothetical protein
LRKSKGNCSEEQMMLILEEKICQFPFPSQAPLKRINPKRIGVNYSKQITIISDLSDLPMDNHKVKKKRNVFLWS